MKLLKANFVISQNNPFYYQKNEEFKKEKFSFWISTSKQFQK